MDAGIITTIVTGLAILGAVHGIIGWSEHLILMRMEDGFRELERKLEATFRLVNK